MKSRNSRPKVGEWLRVVIEGPVAEDAARRGEPFTTLGVREHGWRATNIVSVERIVNPEQDWKQGDIARDARGDLWRWPHSQHSWGLIYCFSGQPDTGPVEPLTLLLRNGEVV